MIIDRSEARMSLNLDTYVGKHDDGREGVVLTKTSQGGLVRVPPSALGGSFFTSGSGVSASLSQGVAPANTDGSGDSVGLTAPNGQLTSVAIWWITFYGPRFGVRFLRDNNANRAPFACIVDGVTYRVGDVAPRVLLGGVSTTPDYEASFLIEDDLGPGPHLAGIALYGDPAGSGSRSINVYGLILDKDHGYVQPPPRAYFPSAGNGVVVPTTAGSIGFSGRVRQMHFTNTGASTRTVTIKRGSNIYQVLQLASGAAGDITFSEPISLTGWTWQVDTGTDVLGWTLTGAPA